MALNYQRKKANSVKESVASGIAACKLCRKERYLQNSHIIPELVYKGLYDDKHRMELLRAPSAVRPANFPKVLQKGIREPLLCRDCEQHINNIGEHYASRVFGGKAGLTLEPLDGGFLMTELDYKKFKLFALSVLWKAGVSENAFFDKVKLGPHAERLRHMLLEGDPGTPTDYPFTLTLLTGNGGGVPATDVIISPTGVRLEGHGQKYYRFVFQQSLWFFFVCTHRKMPLPFLLSDGSITVATCPLSDIRFIKDARFKPDTR